MHEDIENTFHLLTYIIKLIYMHFVKGSFEHMTSKWKNTAKFKGLLWKSLRSVKKKKKKLFNKDAFKWSKVTVKTSIMLQKISIQIYSILSNFLFICESWQIKSISVFTKILCSTTVFNIDNNQKCFLSSKSAY